MTAVDVTPAMGTPLEIWNRWLANARHMTNPCWWEEGYQNQVDCLTRVGKDALEIQRQCLGMMALPAAQAGIAPVWVDVAMDAAAAGLKFQADAWARCMKAAHAVHVDGRLPGVGEEELPPVEAPTPMVAARRGR